MLELRRMRTGQPEGGDPSNDDPPLTEEDLNRVLVELIGDGSVVLQDADEDDADYQPGEDEDEYEEGDDDMDGIEDDDEEDMYGYESVPVAPGKWHEEVKEPKEEGLSLLFNGEFGRIKHQIRSRNKDGNAARFLLNRGSKIRPSYREDMACVSLTICPRSAALTRT